MLTHVENCSNKDDHKDSENHGDKDSHGSKFNNASKIVMSKMRAGHVLHQHCVFELAEIVSKERQPAAPQTRLRGKERERERDYNALASQQVGLYIVEQSLDTG